MNEIKFIKSLKALLIVKYFSITTTATIYSIPLFSPLQFFFLSIWQPGINKSSNYRISTNIPVFLLHIILVGNDCHF